MSSRRPATEKAKATRARSWNKNQAAKQERIAQNERNHQRNLELGTTGKQRANQAAKARKAKIEPVEQEDLLET